MDNVFHRSFFQDDNNIPDCLDASDEIHRSFPDISIYMCYRTKPSFGCEDMNM